MFAVSLTEDAQLRPLEPWQAEEFLAHIDRAREYVDPWIPWATRSTDPDSARAVLQRYADGQAADSMRIYGIWLDGVLVGGTMFVSFHTDTGNCEIGCWLEPAAEGRGLITRAARLMIDWAFRERGMHRVQWVNAAHNVRSANVARRLGMSLDGVMRSAFPYRGQRHDNQVWSVLADEWPPKPA
ncbi:GNAT family N-acetyltransferase [Micromonospora cathayae]|uniref:GNAT family protein n=1 Tax=Micromonospora cathayae TaxID=3028804 RepID=A0ABY7ZMP7_9ACTN|nr:GNAT family protein [Micromonospora sp. HUAS 3]WDZ84182.1 GNAT family protein [Micromonospora sp. HUAS 3]